MMLSNVRPLHILSPNQFQPTTTVQSPFSLERTSLKSLNPTKRMFSSNSTPHGVVTARSSPQSGMSSVKPSRTTKTGSLPSSMPPPTKPKVSTSEDTQPSSSIQRKVEKSTTKA